MKKKSADNWGPLFEVVWPLGKPSVQPVPAAEALDDLNGKTVCELWDGVFRGDEIYPIVRSELQKRFPTVKFVTHETMGNTHDVNEKEYLADLPRLLRQHGVHAVISAIGA